MNFSFSSEQTAFQQAAKDFAHIELMPFAAEWDAKSFFPVDVIRKAGNMGFLSIYIPQKLGGMGLSRLDASIVFEALSTGCTSTTAYITIHNMVTWMIASFGVKSLTDELMPSMVNGDKLGSYCLTEAESGSDAASLKTTATKKNGKYIINGTKVFISGAGSTQILVVMARTEKQEHDGITAFVVPAEKNGITYGRKEEKMGWNSQPTRTVTFNNVQIPESHKLGKEGNGFKIAMMGLDGGRVNIASCSLGTAQQALTTARNYMLERKQFGRPISSFQALRFDLADMQTELEAAKLLVRMAADKLDKKDPESTIYCAMAKRYATDVSFNICDKALQIHGGYGYIKEYPLERYVRDTRVHRILEGSNEIMRVIISKKLLSEDKPKIF